jgi:citrate lyase beta subunit
VVYGGAHLFRADTAAKLGSLAVQTLTTYAPTGADLVRALGLPGEQADRVHAKLLDKLHREPVEDLRVDFEDGYGVRPDAEEDGHAVASGQEAGKGLAAGTLPPSFGIRVKALDAASRARAARTLDLFLTALARSGGGCLPPGFVVTLPKVVSPDQVGALASLLDALEARLGLPAGAAGIELMIETPEAVLGPRGEAALPALVEGGRGRVTAAHFGVYDYTASLGITAAHQILSHPACDLARQVTLLAACSSGVRVYDGATTVLPLAPHRGPSLTDAQRDENRQSVHRAWKIHYDNVRRALEHGIYQGWDLHPAQLPARHAAVLWFFLEGIDAAAERLRVFVERAARATTLGGVFDDAATGQGLLNLFLRAIGAGAVTEAEAARRTGIPIEALRTRSFAAILAARSTTGAPPGEPGSAPTPPSRQE